MRQLLHKGILVLIVGLMPLSGAAGPGGTYFLVRDGVLCDIEKIACLRATVTYHKGTRTFAVRGRVLKSERPGVLQLILQAGEREERIPTVYVDVPITGRPTQIVDIEVISEQRSDITDWEVLCVLFVNPGDETSRVLPPRPE
jgi:hypothetical protein